MVSEAVECVLVGVDDSDAAHEALEYAVALAAAYDASVYVLEVLGESTTAAIAEDRIEPDRISARSEALFQEIAEVAAAADVELRSGVAYGYSTQRKLVQPGTVVLDVAEEIDAGFIVLPRETPGDEAAGVLAKSAEYALLYATQPVVAV